MNSPAMDITRFGLGAAKAPPKPGAPGSKRGRSRSQTPFQPVSQRFPALEKREVILTHFSLVARKASVAGSFNNWTPRANPLRYTGSGKWVVRLMLRSGQYEYRFVVDGRWIEDFGASQRVANPYGGFNSVLVVPLAVKTSIL